MSGRVGAHVDCADTDTPAASSNAIASKSQLGFILPVLIPSEQFSLSEHALEPAAMERAGTVSPERQPVLLGRVPLVPREAVLRKSPIRFVHEAVPCDLRDDGRCRDGGRTLIAADQVALRATKSVEGDPVRDHEFR